MACCRRADGHFSPPVVTGVPDATWGGGSARRPAGIDIGRRGRFRWPVDVRHVGALPPAAVLELLAAWRDEGWMSLAHIAVALVGLGALMACCRAGGGGFQEGCQSCTADSAPSERARTRDGRRRWRGRHRATGPRRVRSRGKASQVCTRLTFVKTSSEEFLKDSFVVVDSVVFYKRDVERRNRAEVYDIRINS